MTVEMEAQIGDGAVKIGRTIGIRHRVKRTAEGESRPTEICILDHIIGEAIAIKLEDEDAELDFVLGRFPTSWRKTTSEDRIESRLPHHIKWKRVPTQEIGTQSIPEHLIKMIGKTAWYAEKVPETTDGLAICDKIAMTLGGSGDRMAFALTNRGLEIGATVHRIPPSVFKSMRPDDQDFKDDDSRVLAETLERSPEHFYTVKPRDAGVIRIREALRARNDAMKARIACEQRLRSRFIGSIFLSSDGKFPEGAIEDEFDAKKSSDVILRALIQEEKGAENELKKACESLDIYNLLFEPIEGVGIMIASRIIAAIGDVRLFPSKAKLKAFMGAHVLKDGRFPRRRGGEVANWHPDARQALFLLVDQFNRRPNSIWGQVLLHYKAKLRENHPEPIKVDGKSRYTDGHIHKMALWRTATKFVEWLYNNWTRIERDESVVPKQLPPSIEDDTSNQAEAA